MEKWDMNTPKKDVERILKESFLEIRQGLWNAGLPVVSVDEVGVYKL